MSVHAADGGLLVRDVFDDVCVHVRLGAVDVVLLRARFRGDARKEAGELVDLERGDGVCFVDGDVAGVLRGRRSRV